MKKDGLSVSRIKRAFLPKVLAGLKWVTSGMWNGSEGTWTLIVDVATQTIIHFQFKSSR